jgi:ribonuclease HI
MNDTWTIYTDGGSRGNPGPAAYAYVIKRAGAADIEEKCYLGQTTNNIAEYTGMVKALEHALELGGRRIVVNSDSELMVKQMNGEYRVKNEGLKPLFDQASKLRRQFESVTFKHVYREQNSQADGLCNEAMDDRSPTVADARRPVAASKEPPTAKVVVTPRLQALDVLTASAAAWAESGDAANPKVSEVLDRILAIMGGEK